MANGYKGRIYQEASGPWAFKFYEDDIEVGGRSGFETEAQARQSCVELLGEIEIESVKLKDLPG